MDAQLPVTTPAIEPTRSYLNLSSSCTLALGHQVKHKGIDYYVISSLFFFLLLILFTFKSWCFIMLVTIRGDYFEEEN